MYFEQDREVNSLPYLGLVLALAGTIVLGFMNLFQSRAIPHFRKVMTLLSISLMCIGVGGAIVQHLEANRRDRQLTHLYARDLQDLKRAAESAFLLGIRSHKHRLLRAQLHSPEGLQLEKIWVEADLKLSKEEIEILHKALGIDFVEVEPPDIPDMLLQGGEGFVYRADQYIGTFFYYDYVLQELYSGYGPEIPIWFGLGYNAALVTVLMESGFIERWQTPVDDIESMKLVVSAARTLGIPQRLINDWKESLEHLSDKELWSSLDAFEERIKDHILTSYTPSVSD